VVLRGTEKLFYQAENNNEGNFSFKGQVLSEEEGPIVTHPLVPAHPIENGSGFLLSFFEYSDTAGVHCRNGIELKFNDTLNMISQLKFDRVGINIQLVLKVVLIVFSDIVVDQGNGYNEWNQGCAIVFNHLQ